MRLQITEIVDAPRAIRERLEVPELLHEVVVRPVEVPRYLQRLQDEKDDDQALNEDMVV